MYGFNKDTKEITGSIPMDPVIQENVRLVKQAYEHAKVDDPETVKVYALYFENEDGQQLRHVEFPIDPDVIKEKAEKRGDDPESALRRSVEAQGRRLKHILTKYIPEDKAVTNAETFKQYVAQVYKLFPKNYAEVMVRLKVYVNWKQTHIALPNYTPFIELMSVPREESSLRYSTSELADIQTYKTKRSANSSSKEDDESPTEALDALSDSPGLDPISDDDLPF